MNNRLAWGTLAALVFAGTQSPARAVPPEEIRKAVDRGVAALRSMQLPDGTWPLPHIGATALAGLTLLECDVKDDDPAVLRAAAAVRKASIELTHTYSISLAVLFLDRLGDPQDKPLIESLMVRLLAGQNAETGGWTYDCFGLNAAEAKRLKEIVDGRKELKGTRQLPKEGLEKKTFRDLSPETQKLLQGISRGSPAAPGAMPGGAPGFQPGGAGRPAGGPPGAFPPAGGPPPSGDAPGLTPPPGPPGGAVSPDNSNTQFAAMALWVGRRQGFPIENALKLLDARFRSTQRPDGGWRYQSYVLPPGTPMPMMRMPSEATMTCAGILALAIADGATLEYLKEQKPDARIPNINQDKNLMLALELLGEIIGNPRGLQLNQGFRPGAQFVPQQRVAGRTYYFFWSLERCAVALGLETIGKKDWYNWGAEILLENQAADGAWYGEYAASGADTCFALLFLRKANLARDLTAHLRSKIKDPGERVLRGGVGIGSTRGKKSIPSGIELKDAKLLQKPTDGGSSSEAKLPDTESGRRAGELVKATGARQAELLEQMKNEKGSVQTEALATAIPYLDGESHRKAREALAERLTRMKDETLTGYLQDDDVEIRRAAALAIGMKESKSLVPNLIPMLRDPEITVARAAHAALKELTGQDFGPASKATREERDQAVIKWLQWWGQQRKKAVKE
jgi:hypothetical protein